MEAVWGRVRASPGGSAVAAPLFLAILERTLVPGAAAASRGLQVCMREAACDRSYRILSGAGVPGPPVASRRPSPSRLLCRLPVGLCREPLLLRGLRTGVANGDKPGVPFLSLPSHSKESVPKL